MNLNIIAKIGSSASVICILFLPLIGCSGDEITGMQILSHDDMWIEVKALLVASIVCGILAVFVTNRIYRGVMAALAIGALTIAFMIATNRNAMFYLKWGAYASLVGFLVTLITSFVPQPDDTR